MAQLRIDNKSLHKIVKAKESGAQKAALNYNQALKEIRSLDPSFMKKGVRYSTQKLTPQQKGAITTKAAQLKKEILGTFGQDLYTPSKKKGETKTAYNKRINDLKKAYGQEDLKAKGVYLQPPENGGARYKLGKDGSIETIFKNNKGEAFKNRYVGASKTPPDFNSIKIDIRKAFKIGRKDFNSINVTLYNRRTDIAFFMSFLNNPKEREKRVSEMAGDIMKALTPYANTTTGQTEIQLKGYTGLILE